MIAAPKTSVIITAGDTSISLAPSGPPAEFWRVSVTAVAGPFHGKFITEVHGPAFTDLHHSLEQLRETSRGEFYFNSCSGLSLTIVGGPRKGIRVDVLAFPERQSNATLGFSIKMDRGYLPEIIQAIERVFVSAFAAKYEVIASRVRLRSGSM